jgi:hypothetical protein
MVWLVADGGSAQQTVKKNAKPASKNTVFLKFIAHLLRIMDRLV